MVVVKLLQKGSENVMFGHPAGNTFAQVSSSCRFLIDKTYCCVMTRDGQVFEDMRATEALTLV